jgi:hypothetical protein
LPPPLPADPQDHAPRRFSPVVAHLDLERATRVLLAVGIKVGDRVISGSADRHRYRALPHRRARIVSPRLIRN